MSQAQARTAEDVQAALARGDAKGALALVREAEAAAPGDLQLKLQRAMVCRALGDLAGAAAALDEALAIDPYDYVALLSKGAVIERLQGEKAAAAIYRNALKVGPPDAHMPAPFKVPFERARQVVARVQGQLEDHLRAKAREVAADCSAPARRRFEESIGILSGRARVYTQEPLLLHYPRPPAIPFHEREHFPWLPTLEAATDTIRGELDRALKAAA